jgi:hypothetical protein
VAGFLTGYTFGLCDTLYPDRRTPLLGINVEDDRSDKRLHPIGADSREDLKECVAVLTAVDSDKRLALLLAC